MGLTVHFKGQLRDTKQLLAFVDEVEDIANSLEWESHRIDQIVPIAANISLPEQRVGEGIQIRGLHVTPPQCETICFTFAPSGKLMSVLNALSIDLDPELDLAYWLHTKTQSAGIEVHIAIISLFRYLSHKYFQSFEVSDEGEYWESNDIELLTYRFEEYTALIATVKGALEKEMPSSNLSESDLLRQIVKIIQKGLDELE